MEIMGYGPGGSTPGGGGAHARPTKLFGVDFSPMVGKSPLTRFIIWACAAVWVLSLFFPAIVSYGALSWKGLSEEYWWQPVTYIFLHAGLIHLLFNMLALDIFVSSVEKRIGHLGWFAIFMAAGLAGGITQLLVHAGRAEYLVGASGGVMGIWGAMIACAIRIRRLPNSKRNLSGELNLRELLIWLALQMILDQSVGFIAAFCHLGGLVTGFLIAMFLPMRGSKSVVASRQDAAQILIWQVVTQGEGSTCRPVRFRKVIFGLAPDFDEMRDFVVFEEDGLDWLSRSQPKLEVLQGAAPDSAAHALWVNRVMLADPTYLAGIGNPADAYAVVLERKRLAEQSERDAAAGKPPTTLTIERTPDDVLSDQPGGSAEQHSKDERPSSDDHPKAGS